ncbi:MAG: hypothetical protein Fur005_34390 [Roseiflexaceae bacterium]
MLRSRRGLLLPLALPLGLFLVGAYLAVMLSYDPGRATGWLIFLTLNVVIAAIIPLIVQNRQHVQIAAGVAVGYATLVAIAIVFQYRYLTWLDEFGPATVVGRLLSAPFPFMINLWLPANAAAATFEGPLPLAVGLAVASRGRLRIAWIICAVLLALGLFVTASRGAWVAVVVAGFVGGLAVLRMQDQPGARLLAGAAGGAALVIVFGVIAIALFSPESVGSILFRASDRATLYRNSLFLALDVPFTGIGGGPIFAQAYAQLELLIQVPFLTYPHNMLLSVWLWHGLIGLVGFLMAALVAGRLVWRALPKLGPVGLGAALGGLTILLHGITDAPQYDKTIVMFAASLTFGVLVAAAWVVDSRPLQWIRPGRVGYAIGAVVLVLVAVLAGPGLAARASANAAWLSYSKAVLPRQIDQQVAQGYLQEARSLADRGMTIAPNTPAVLKVRGLTDLMLGEYGSAIAALERAAPGLPSDQATLKGLGLAYIWYGYTEEGAKLLMSIDRVMETYEELGTWETAWRERGRDDLADRAAEARIWMDRLATTVP